MLHPQISRSFYGDANNAGARISTIMEWGAGVKVWDLKKCIFFLEFSLHLTRKTNAGILLNHRPRTPIFITRTCRGGDANPPRVSKLMIVELRKKQWIALDEYSRLVVFFFFGGVLGKYLTKL